ncbi:diaminopimelate epimerase [Thermodesulfitimonas autotrophica]|uniref:diaminopimelate epimerase n=1 Tax=Thermodesulfitimonas autotrophica TaxID=1894989 RepID=UPI002FE4110A
MASLRFLKMHGLGNDFVVVKADSVPEQPDTLARVVCDRHFGVGADGLVFILPSEKADLRMRIFNPDGSEAEMCGNAIRCVAKYAYESGMVRKTALRVETGAGILMPRLHLAGERVATVEVDMGEPVLERGAIPMDGPPGCVINELLTVAGESFRVTAVSFGNPHCVIFVSDVAAVDLAALGPKIEHHPAFPRRTNVEFVQVLDPERIRVRVWERGAGATLACGTGACAAAVAGALNGLTGRQVRVGLPGGELFIRWAADNHVYMTGPAAAVFAGEWLGEEPGG